MFPHLNKVMAPPTLLDLAKGQPQGVAAVEETTLGDRQMAVFVEDNVLSTTCEHCK